MRSSGATNSRPQHGPITTSSSLGPSLTSLLKPRGRITPFTAEAGRLFSSQSGGQYKLACMQYKLPHSPRVNARRLHSSRFACSCILNNVEDGLASVPDDTE
ncbi:UNVERIFIED_CONTAM: hypothetical protein FKN15_005983 [Acipenser sinensis]